MVLVVVVAASVMVRCAAPGAVAVAGSHKADLSLALCAGGRPDSRFGSLMLCDIDSSHERNANAGTPRVGKIM